MTVRELIEALESEDPEAEVRLMIQPAWPFEHAVGGVWGPGQEDADEDEAFQPTDTPAAGAVYLLEGHQYGYGTKRAWS